jgi:hypothetical protein
MCREREELKCSEMGAKPASQEYAYPGRLGRDIGVAVADSTDALLALRFEADS